MSTNIVKDLEHAAIAAYERGDMWMQFHADMGAMMRAAEPVNARRYHKLADHLLALVVSGDVDGHEPIDDDVMPWERDDAGQVSDTTTNAKLQPGYLFDARPLYE